jgi:quinol monooxygenase YgiN
LSIYFIARWRAKESAAELLIAALKDLAEETRSFEGCERLELFCDAEDNRTLLLMEQWASAERYEAYQNFRHESGVRSSLRDLMDKPPAIERIRPI